MRSFLPSGRWAGLCFGVFTATLTLAPTSQAQPAPPASPPRPVVPAGGVQRVEIYQGVNHFVDYVPYGTLSLTDHLAARDLQRAENELTYLDNLQRLKQQYVNSEREMEPRRLYAQEELYGLSITVGGYSGGGYYGGGYYGGWGGRGYSYPYTWNGNRYGLGYGGGLGGMAGGTGWMANRSLAHGMGDEGVMKNTLTQGIAREASPEYAASAVKGFHDAVTAAARSDVLRPALMLGQNPVGLNWGRTVGYPVGPTLFTLRCHPSIAGTVAREDAFWVVVRTAWGEVSIPRSQVLSYEPIPQLVPAPKPMKPVGE